MSKYIKWISAKRKQDQEKRDREIENKEKRQKDRKTDIKNNSK